MKHTQALKHMLGFISARGRSIVSVVSTYWLLTFEGDISAISRIVRQVLFSRITRAMIVQSPYAEGIAARVKRLELRSVHVPSTVPIGSFIGIIVGTGQTVVRKWKCTVMIRKCQQKSYVRKLIAIVQIVGSVEYTITQLTRM